MQDTDANGVGGSAVANERHNPNPAVAEFTLTLKDTESGQIEITANFDPPISRDGAHTQAQLAGLALIERVQDIMVDPIPQSINGVEVKNAG